ncbi:hypothetical protein EIP91_007702 [Steccherinum ochraceum]|uniref:Uncharacterized protein n=1 Tax=Steccherinum ochraceum TaxID=92696 RepID=A0A4R0RHY8_9APHY|nr:hypothetical protein EIP91_007702 [Steccherinum ochraceum]
MLPVQFSQSTSQGALYATGQSFPSSQSFQSSQSLGFSDVMNGFDSRTFSQQSLAVDPSFTNAEYNTPETFKQNMHAALELLARVQALARSALAGIEHAYRPGNNPMQTAGVGFLSKGLYPLPMLTIP